MTEQPKLDLSETAAPKFDGVPLGEVYLPRDPGTPVGTFQFIVDPVNGSGVEVGTPVTAVTTEGTFIGAIIDLRTVGSASDPVRSDLGGAIDVDMITRTPSVVVATVQVFHSPARRPVNAGLVRAATQGEMLLATGADKMRWPIPAGVVPMADGSFARVAVDGHYLLGPEAGHLVVNGISGSAKTSYAGVLLRSAIHTGAAVDESTAALVFNVKGDDLLYLDQPPAEGYELTEEDLAMYEALDLPAEPFEDVEVWAPGLPGGQGANSPRADARAHRIGLEQIWPYLKYLFPWMYEDEKLVSFFAQFADRKLFTSNPRDRISTFGDLDRWFQKELDEAEMEERTICFGNTHVATMMRIRRMLMALPARCKGLITNETPRSNEDLPITGWSHGQVVVVDIAGLPTDVQAVVVARMCERLLASAEEGELGVSHLAIIADELNSFAPSSGGEMGAVRKILQRISSQGRYAGVSMWGACQKMSKVDEQVRDNAATRVLGMTADGELSSGVYGRLPGGLFETIATLPKGQMALTHYSYRAPLVIKFPRPAWRTGRSKTSGAARPKMTSVLKASTGDQLSEKSVQRLTEGLPPEVVDRVIAQADHPERAVDALNEIREPDMSKSVVHEKSTFDPDNPFGLDDD